MRSNVAQIEYKIDGNVKGTNEIAAKYNKSTVDFDYTTAMTTNYTPSKSTSELALKYKQSSVKFSDPTIEDQETYKRPSKTFVRNTKHNVHFDETAHKS